MVTDQASLGGDIGWYILGIGLLHRLLPDGWVECAGQITQRAQVYVS